jgi:Tfp pilus assembly protein PilN
MEFGPSNLAALAWRLTPIAWPFLMVGLVFVGVAGWRLWAMQQETQVARQVAVNAEIKARANAASAQRNTEPPVSPTQAALVNAAVQQLNVPWGELLDGLESAGSRKVALLEVRVEPQAKRLLGTAEVADYPEIFAYLQRLKREAIFTSVVLSSHQINENDKQKPYRFEFTLIWKDTP